MDSILGEKEVYFNGPGEKPLEKRRVARIKDLFEKVKKLPGYIELHDIGELERLIEDYVTVQMVVRKWSLLIDSDPVAYANLERLRKNRETQYNSLRSDLGFTVARMNQLSKRKPDSESASVSELATMGFE